VYYYDLTTPFGQGVQQMVSLYRTTSRPSVTRFEFTKNPDGRCWLTLVQF